MVIHGHIQNGMIIPHGGISLPEGAEVTIVVRDAVGERMPGESEKPQSGRLSEARGIAVDSGRPSAQVRKKGVEFPLVKTGEPGSLHLTNKQFHEIFENEDVEAQKTQWNVPS